MIVDQRSNEAIYFIKELKGPFRRQVYVSGI